MEATTSKPKGASPTAGQIARPDPTPRDSTITESSDRATVPRSTLRLLLAGLVVFAWLFMAVGFGVSAWLLAPSGTTYLPTSPNIAFTGLLRTANNVCPAGKSYFLVSDDVPVYQLADYYMYPRRAVRLTAADPFDGSTLAGHAGDCVIAYYPQNVARVEAFMPRLNRLGCAANDRSCLYLIK